MNECPAASKNMYICGNCGKEWEYGELHYLPWSTIKCCPGCNDTRLSAKRKEEGVFCG